MSKRHCQVDGIDASTYCQVLKRCFDCTFFKRIKWLGKLSTDFLRPKNRDAGEEGGGGGRAPLLPLIEGARGANVPFLCCLLS